MALRRVDRPDLAARREHIDALGHAGAAFFVQKTDQRFAHGQLGDRRGDVQARVLPHGVCRCFDSFLVARGEGAQGVLYAVAQLCQNAVGDVERVLRHKIHPHTFGAHQAHDELDAL